MKKYFKMIIFTLIYIILPLFCNIMVIKLIGETKFIKSMTMVTPMSIFIVLDIIALTALFLFVKYVRKAENPFKFASFKKVSSSNIMYSAGLGFLLAVVTITILNIQAFKPGSDSIGGSIDFIIGGNILLLFFATAINNMYKEICFRGLAFNEMKILLPVIVALFIQATFYAGELMYFGNSIFAVLYAFLGQLIFGIIFVVGRSIWSSYTAQMICTTGLVLLRRTGIRELFNNTNSIILLVLSTIAIIVLMIILNRKSVYDGNQPAPKVQMEV